MSEEKQGQAAGAAGGKKSGSAVGRIAIWVVILVLAGLAYFEWQAKNGYEKTFEAVKPLINDEAEGVSYATVESKIMGSPKTEEAKEGSDRSITLTWSGILKSYTMKFKVGGATGDILNWETEGADQEGAGAKASE